jgi:hypothetical protein
MDPPRRSQWNLAIQPEVQVAELRALLREELQAQGADDLGASYCWWCQANINGMDGGPVEPHDVGVLAGARGGGAQMTPGT